jgi:hypothetical protein
MQRIPQKGNVNPSHPNVKEPRIPVSEGSGLAAIPPAVGSVLIQTVHAVAQAMRVVNPMIAAPRTFGTEVSRHGKPR